MTWRITSKFGDQESFRKSPHKGYDFSMKEGEPLYSIRDGTLRIEDYGDTNAGKCVLVTWEDGKTAIYGHLSKFAEGLKTGDVVEKGQLIGYVGNTGHSYGSHLHFGLKEGGRYINPSPYIEDIQNMKLIAKSPEKLVHKDYSIFDMLKFNDDTVSGFLKMLSTNFINLINQFL